MAGVETVLRWPGFDDHMRHDYNYITCLLPEQDAYRISNVSLIRSWFITTLKFPCTRSENVINRLVTFRQVRFTQHVSDVSIEDKSIALVQGL